mgnify:CR=1 FL=1
MLIPTVAIGIIIVILILVMRNTEGAISVKTVLKYTPENTCLAMAVLFLFFALKSLTVILPLSALYLASGILFSPFMALFVSTCGLAITLTIPYLIGYFSGKKVVLSIQEKHPKTQKIMEYQKKNTFFENYFCININNTPPAVHSHTKFCPPNSNFNFLYANLICVFTVFTDTPNCSDTSL